MKCFASSVGFRAVAWVATALLWRASVCLGAASEEGFSSWPPGAAPAEVGRLAARNFLERKLDCEVNPKRAFVIYPEACAWYGALSVAQLSGDRPLQEQLMRKFEPLLGAEGAKRISAAAHVDYRVLGIVPLEIACQHGDSRCLQLGQGLADKQWSRTTADGLTAEARYWIDDMFMIPALQVQAFRATGNTNYLERAALTMDAYLDRLQQTNGLFLHAPDVPIYWGRGNGWVAVGMSELLRDLPANHPRRPHILSAFRQMMEALRGCQGRDGLWGQVLDHPESWPESSGTGMFGCAMTTGVKRGWLEASLYGPAVRKAWLGLMQHIEPNGDVRDVCEGTSKKNDLGYYLARKRKTGDLHGQAAVLWFAAALIRPAP